MAKRKAKETTDAPAEDNGHNPAGEETVSGYFRRLLEQNPAWLTGRSTQALLDRSLRDNPGQREVPDRVRQNLSNVKSVLRKKLRGKAGGPKRESQPVVAATPAAVPRRGVGRLELLEGQIDECLASAPPWSSSS
jgi:hypothetical protein